VSAGPSGLADSGDPDGRLGWVRERVWNSVRIARWEVTKNAGGVDRRTVVIAVGAVLALGVIIPLAMSQGVALDSDIYRIGVAEEDPYYDVVSSDSTFRVQEPSPAAVEAGNQDVLVVGAQVREITDGPKGRAAAAELRSTTNRYNDRLMLAEDNQTAAFPVLVNLTYREQNQTRVIITGEQSSDSGPDADGGGTDGGGSDGGGGGGADSGGDGADGAGGTDGADDADGPTDPSETGGSVSSDSDDGGIGGSGFAARLTGGGVDGTPSDITPPFPFRSLVLAFVFVLPLNFVIQAYGSTILSERINRRGELLLVAPVSRGDIIVGKTLPYFLGAVGVMALIAAALGGSPVSVLAVTPLALLFLSATFLGAMFARSFKELTFVTVTITVSLTSYAFIPAIFTDVTPIALISPLTLVVRDFQGQAIGLGEFAFSVAPPVLTALVMFGLGAGLYREEDMFTQRPIPLKVLDALAGRIKRKRSVALLSAVLLPFVFVAELVVIALLFALGEISILLVLIAVAIIEEIAKSLHIYAGYAHARFDRRLRTALVLGFLSGLGFFVAEKFTQIAQLADLPNLEIGQAALNTGLLPTQFVSTPVLILGLFLAPLALHSVTAALSAIGASRGRWGYVVGLSAAIALHTAYNLTVVMALVG